MPNPIFDAPLTSTLVPTTAGNPTFTFSRVTSAAYVADNEGILRLASFNEARFQGARRVRNCITTNSQDMSSVAWTKQACTIAFGVTGPTGLADANTVTATGAALVYQITTISPSTGVLSISSMWLRRRSGTGPVFLRNAANVDIDITSQLTAAWKRFTTAPTVSATTYSVLRIDVSGDQIDAAYAQVEQVDGQSNQAPGDYVSVGVLSAPYHGAGVDGSKCFATTNGNSVAGNIVTEAQGTLIPAATLLGYVAENAATNLCLQSQTFDFADWTKTNGTVTANTQAAPDGTLTADTFTDNATNGPHAVQQGTLSYSAASWTGSIYCKAGTLSWVRVELYDSSGKWANFNLQTGAVGNKSAGVTAAVTTLPSGWFRFSVSATLAVSSGFLTAYSLPSDLAASPAPYVGTGQTMYLWGAQVEQSSDPTSYIPTTTAAVVRNVDALVYQAATNLDGATATIYTEVRPLTASVGSQDVILRKSPSFYPQYYESTKTLGNYSGAGVVNTVNTRLPAAMNKNAVAWSGATCSVCLNGATVATGAFTAYSNTGNIEVGVTFPAMFRNVKFYATRLTDAQLVDLTEDGVLTPDPEPPSTAAGHGGTAARYRRRRIEVEIDGEIFPVASEEEGRELLLKAREAAKQAAQAAAVRAAAKAEKKTSPAAVERALALSTPRISLRADDRSEALAQAIQAQVDAAQAAIDEDYATARRMAYAYVRQRLQDEQRQRELAADEEEVIAMILRLP